jgi:putative nucleotidyltransferase with HDIG domain
MTRVRSDSFAHPIVGFPSVSPPPLPSSEREVADAIAAAMWRSLSLHDELTAAHCTRVAERSVALAEACGIDRAERWALRRGALLHDVGKLGISDVLLNKPGRLDDRERVSMNRHPEDGFALVEVVAALDRVRDLVLSHHERWDGHGYPHGLAGEAIPLAVRVLAVCDTYDAMTCSRPYRDALPHERAIEEIVRCAGTQFDPEVVRVMVAVSERP